MIPSQIESALKPLGAAVEGATDRLIRMRRVPTGHGFSKPRTGVVLIRQAEGEPFAAMLVDEDLHYTGSDSALTNLFGSSTCRNNWRVLPLHDAGADPCKAVRLTLQLLGNDRAESSLTEPSLLERYGVSALAAHPFPTFGRERDLLSAISFVAQQTPGVLLVGGDEGAGKSAFVAALARRMSGREFVTVNLAAFFAGASSEHARERLLARLLEEAAKHRFLVLVLDRLEWLGYPPVLCDLSRACLSGPVVGMLPRPHVPRFSAGIRRSGVIELEGLDHPGSLAALDSRRISFEAHHGIHIPPELAAAVLERSIPMQGFLPENAIALLDLACARAAAEKAPQLEEIHVLLAASEIEGYAAAAAPRGKETLR